MNMQVFVYKYLPFVIIGTAAFSLLLIITTLIMCLSLDHLEYKNIFPTVSLTGAYDPEHILYEAGFTVITLLMLFITYIVHSKLIHPQLKNTQETWRCSLNIVTCVVCVIGLIGLVMQSYMPCRKEEKLHYKLHMIFAVIFFVGIGVYVTLTSIIIFPLKFFRRTLFFKICTNVMYLFGGFSYVFGYFIRKKSTESRLERAIAEWIAVFGYIAYFLSFSADLLKAKNEVLRMQSELQMDNPDRNEQDNK